MKICHKEILKIAQSGHTDQVTKIAASYIFTSVCRFREIAPLWQKLKRLWQYVSQLRSWQNDKSTLAIL